MLRRTIFIFLEHKWGKWCADATILWYNIRCAMRRERREIMAKVDIFSGFLGAGKTTLIRKLIAEAYKGEQVVLIENEFGDIGIDSDFLKDAGIEITEMNSGCICCTLVGDFTKAIHQVVEKFNPDRIIIEPSGVGKLSDIIAAVAGADADLELSGTIAVVDAKKCAMYMKNFGEFFNNQIESANAVILSHVAGVSEEKIEKAVEMLRELNHDAAIITTDWSELDAKQIHEAMESGSTLKEALHELEAHEHHHHEHGECCHDHGHDHDHEHHHEGEEDCCCHGHHHHHDADEIFESIGIETARKFEPKALEAVLAGLENEEKFGFVLRAKGIVPSEDGWMQFDYVPGEPEVRTGAAAGLTGRICVIGSKLNQDEIKKAFLK